MGHQTAAGVTLGISLVPPATFDQVGYDALTFNPVGEVTNIGEFGEEVNLVTHNPLSTKVTEKGKGSRNRGTLNPSMALDQDDAGQSDMETSLEGDGPAWISITLQSGAVFYLEVLVMSFKVNIGGVDDIVTATSSLEVTAKKPVKKAA